VFFVLVIDHHFLLSIDEIPAKHLQYYNCCLLYISLTDTTKLHIYTIYIQQYIGNKIIALNIANRNVEEKAIQASRILGVNKTAAVEIALDYYLEHYGFKEKDSASRKESARLLDELAALPVLDHRKPDEIIGYDENGLL
jgi:antitoxin VapB